MALLELTLEASRDPELARACWRRTAARWSTSSGACWRPAGRPHGAAAAETLVASFDGVLIAALAPARGAAAAFVRRSIEALMAGLG